MKPGDPVCVRTGIAPGHIRTPRYIQGKRGIIERVCGRFANPEELAYGRDGGEQKVLYRVRFRQREVWPHYAGPDSDTVDIELYEHWLYPEAGT